MVKGGRKTKKEWRKNVDISEVEKHLEAQRKNALEGGALEERPNESIFTVDKSRKDTAVTKEQWKNRLKSLTSQKILEPNPFTPVVSSRKVSQRKTFKRKEILVHAEEPSMTTPTVYSLWKDSNPGIRRVKGKSTAVTIDHPGTSYRPSSKAHVALIDKAVQEELKLQEEKARIRKKLGTSIADLKKRNAMDIVQSVTDMVDEDIMSQTQLNPAEEEDEEVTRSSARSTHPGKHRNTSTSADADNPTSLSTKATQRKSLMDKKREQRRKSQKQLEDNKKQEKQFNRSIDQFISEPPRRSKSLESPKKTTQNGKKKVSRLGPYKVEKLPQAILLDDELPASLRELKTEGNLLKERLVSFQERHLLEPRQRAKVTRKHKLKTYTQR